MKNNYDLEEKARLAPPVKLK